MFWLLLAVGAFWAFRTNPPPDSFDLRRTGVQVPNDDNNQSKSSLSRFLPSFLRSAPQRRPPPIQYTNYHLFGIAFVPQTNEYYLGCFGGWYFLYSPAGWVQRRSSESPVPLAEVVATAENIAEQSRANAIKSKANRDYRAAAEWFSKAASSLETSSAINSCFEAGAAYEEASKMYRMNGRTDDYEISLMKAIAVYERSGSRSMGTRIARIYESLSTHQMSTGRAEQAADSLKRAIECYQMEDDKRYLGLISSLADLEASRNRYVEAERLFDSLLHSSEPAFAFRRSDFVLSRGLCLLAIACSDDSGTTPLADVQSLLSGEAESRQTELLAKLLQAFNNSDRDEWNRVVDDYARRSVIDGWRLQLLRQLPEQFNELR